MTLPRMNMSRASSRSKGLSERKRRMVEFMRAHPTGVLSSTTPDGDPHGTVMYYAADNELAVHFLTRKRTRKYDNLKHNPHVMLTVFDVQTQTVLQLTGIALELAGQVSVNEVAGMVLEIPVKTSVSGLPPVAKLQAGAFVAFVIEPVRVRMASYAKSEPGDYNELFESVESFELGED